MKIAIWIIAAVVSYYVSGLNTAIILSNAIYHRDIRECGSGNPGFTNFKRSFGSKYAWFVFVADIGKGILLGLVFGWLFALIYEGSAMDMRQVGTAYTLIWAMLGHAFPVQYKFKGGKGFLVCISTLWIIDWRVGLCVTVFFVILLLIIKYMSLTTMIALSLGAVALFFTGTALPAAIMYACCVLFMIWRHKENIGRLIHGTESKFSLGGKKKENKEPEAAADGKESE